jgi:hypothetical protein
MRVDHVCFSFRACYERIIRLREDQDRPDAGITRRRRNIDCANLGMRKACSDDSAMQVVDPFRDGGF